MQFSVLATFLWASATLGITHASSSEAMPDQDGKYTITGPGIRASFIAYGAAISNLYINSTAGKELDIVLGYDNASYYSIDKVHPFFGGVVGRYANRIKNSTFEIDGQKYNVLPNDNPTKEHPKGVDTLHGGPEGYDWRNWTVEKYTSNSITFSLVDPDGKEGFPGEVVNYVTYTLGNMTWDIRMVALATTKITPIMLSSHVYWNLDGFTNEDTPLALNHSLYMPYAGQRVGTDSILIPTGDILANKKGGPNDFWSAPKQIGKDYDNPEIVGNCGFNCSGYDTCYILNRPPPSPISWQDDLVTRLHSAYSGIQLDVFTDQQAFQVYSCVGQNGSIPIKSTQGYPGGPRNVQKNGCVVLEVQDYIDGINNPEWGRQKHQIYGPGNPYVLQAKYVFSLNGTREE